MDFLTFLLLIHNKKKWLAKNNQPFYKSDKIFHYCWGGAETGGRAGGTTFATGFSDFKKAKTAFSSSSVINL